jgi:NADP-dependent alcohol dehydrogenase
VFGKGSIAQLKDLLPADARVMLLYGGGSIKRNGVYGQVQAALAGRAVVEFGGIEPNPQHDTCMKALALVRSQRIDFLLAVGGGSVIDATKYVAASAVYQGADPWDLLLDAKRITGSLPFGSVLTLPGTGSEWNGGAVISRESIGQKLFFVTEHTMPRFSILDPESTFSLPPRQTANGTIDAFVQVLEQYMTFDVDAPLQDRMAEGILQSIIQEAPKVLANPNNYEARANLMWCAANGLNGLIACGVPQDWASHMIGHELTALYGMDHGQTLAVVMPRVMRHQKQRKRAKLLQYARRVWGLNGGDDAAIDQAIAKTEQFFRSLGTATALADYGVPPTAPGLVARRMAERKMRVGEHQDLGQKEVEEILSI